VSFYRTPASSQSSGGRPACSLFCCLGAVAASTSKSKREKERMDVEYVDLPLREPWWHLRVYRRLCSSHSLTPPPDYFSLSHLARACERDLCPRSSAQIYHRKRPRQIKTHTNVHLTKRKSRLTEDVCSRRRPCCLRAPKIKNTSVVCYFRISSIKTQNLFTIDKISDWSKFENSRFLLINLPIGASFSIELWF